MQEALESIPVESWDTPVASPIQAKAIQALEGGRVLYLPNLAFALNDKELLFLNPKTVSPKAKNISFDLRSDRLAGASCESASEEQVLKAMMRRYALMSRKLVELLLPHYTRYLVQAKTSFRPVEIAGRKSSYRKDDSLLHIDAFPSSPTKGQRILRVFTNINPHGKPRIWRVGEELEDVVRKMAPRVGPPIPGASFVLKLLGITKDTRTLYDHYMLRIHDTMKGDVNYQSNVAKEEIVFPAGSSWIVYTDQVSHAAISGQDVLEQTFHLPVNGIRNQATSPLRVLEKFFKKSLV